MSRRQGEITLAAGEDYLIATFKPPKASDLSEVAASDFSILSVDRNQGLIEAIFYDRQPREQDEPDERFLEQHTEMGEKLGYLVKDEKVHKVARRAGSSALQGDL